MKNNKLGILTRLFLIICSVGLFMVLFTPIWRIELNAPQYPEGLHLAIHANDIKGDVAIINGLNHYIGMKTLHKEDFFEFSILPFCITFFISIFFLTAIVNKKKLFYITFFLFVAFGIIAMWDFWRWEYNYGHNLDPHAAIIVPGMAYQPPLIGFKQLLNFGAYSIPDIGGCIFIGCGILLLLAVFLERRIRVKKNNMNLTPILILISILFLCSCNTEPVPIKIGRDNCDFCKMTISDSRFGAEILISTGKVYKFDDIQCLNSYFASIQNNLGKGAKIYFTDFCNNHELILAESCLLLNSQDLKCPMDGHFAAFKNADSLRYVMQTYKGEQIKWSLK